MSKLKALVPPNGIGYQLSCRCRGTYFPGDEGNPPVLGELYVCPDLLQINVNDQYDVVAVWSNL